MLYPPFSYNRQVWTYHPPVILGFFLIECHTGFPDFPYLSDKIGAGFESGLARFPSGRSSLCTLAVTDMLKGLELPEGFAYIATHRRSEHLEALNNAVGINKKPAPGFHACIFQIDSVNASNFTPSVGEHGEGNSAFDHLGEFMIIPHFVDKNAVYAHG
jgi:hypothetical protein